MSEHQSAPVKDSDNNNSASSDQSPAIVAEERREDSPRVSGISMTSSVSDGHQRKEQSQKESAESETNENDQRMKLDPG